MVASRGQSRTTEAVRGAGACGRGGCCGRRRARAPAAARAQSPAPPPLSSRVRARRSPPRSGDGRPYLGTAPLGRTCTPPPAGGSVAPAASRAPPPRPPCKSGKRRHSSTPTNVLVQGFPPRTDSGRARSRSVGSGSPHESCRLGAAHRSWSSHSLRSRSAHSHRRCRSGSRSRTRSSCRRGSAAGRAAAATCSGCRPRCRTLTRALAARAAPGELCPTRQPGPDRSTRKCTGLGARVRAAAAGWATAAGAAGRARGAGLEAVPVEWAARVAAAVAAVGSTETARAAAVGLQETVGAGAACMAGAPARDRPRPRR